MKTKTDFAGSRHPEFSPSATVIKPYRPNYPRVQVSAICEAPAPAARARMLRPLSGWEALAKPERRSLPVNIGPSINFGFHRTKIAEQRKEAAVMAVLTIAGGLGVFLSLFWPLA
jgi:hypothetical protein